jgi:hypothetical protein
MEPLEVAGAVAPLEEEAAEVVRRLAWEAKQRADRSGAVVVRRSAARNRALPEAEEARGALAVVAAAAAAARQRLAPTVAAPQEAREAERLRRATEMQRTRGSLRCRNPAAERTASWRR